MRRGSRLFHQASSGNRELMRVGRPHKSPVPHRAASADVPPRNGNRTIAVTVVMPARTNASVAKALWYASTSAAAHSGCHRRNAPSKSPDTSRCAIDAAISEGTMACAVRRCSISADKSRADNRQCQAFSGNPGRAEDAGGHCCAFLWNHADRQAIHETPRHAHAHTDHHHRPQDAAPLLGSPEPY